MAEDAVSEYIEYVVSIVGEGEWMDYGVVFYDYERTEERCEDETEGYEGPELGVE